MRLAVVHEGPEPKTIFTKLNRVPVTIPPGDSNVQFTTIEEDSASRCPAAASSTNTSSISGSIRRASGSRPRSGRSAAAAQAASSGLIGYQPRSATTVLLSARMSAITTRAPALVR